MGIPDFLITFALWLFFSVVGVGIAAAFGDGQMKTGPGVLIALTVPWIGLAGWPLLVSWWHGNGPVLDYGLTRRPSDLLWGALRWNRDRGGCRHRRAHPAFLRRI